MKREAARDYAKEVYAACATVGFSSARVDKLKALIDDAEADTDVLAALAQEVQSDTIAWLDTGR